MTSIWNKFVDYLKGSKHELKQVTWPTRRETTRFTVLVIAISLAIAGYLALLDYIFTSALEFLI